MDSVNPAGKDGIENELLGLERRFWQAVQDRDVDAAVRLTHFPCLLTGPQGVGKIAQDAFVEMMKAPPCRLDRFELKEPQVQRLGDDVAILAYVVREELTVDGKSISLEAADSSLWMRRGGEWRCAMHTESLLGDPFGRDRVATREPLEQAG